MSSIPTLTLDLRFSYERPEDMRLRDWTPSTAQAPSTAVPGNTVPKPKVLILGRILAEDGVRTELEAVAQVHNLVPSADLDVPSAIRKVAEEHGPFKAVGVGPDMPAFSVKLMFQAVFSNDPFPWRYGPAQFSSLAPHTKLYANPGAGYDTVDVDWITST